MLARRLEPGVATAAAPAGAGTARRPEGRWRTHGQVPTRGPRGEVVWWNRSAPDGDSARWEAVCRVQQRRIAVGMSVTELSRRTAATSAPLRRETLSRVLNGVQPTTWPTVELLADLLDVHVGDLVPSGEVWIDEAHAGRRAAGLVTVSA